MRSRFYIIRRVIQVKLYVFFQTILNLFLSINSIYINMKNPIITPFLMKYSLYIDLKWGIIGFFVYGVINFKNLYHYRHNFKKYRGYNISGYSKFMNICIWLYFIGNLILFIEKA